MRKRSMLKMLGLSFVTAMALGSCTCDPDGLTVGDTDSLTGNAFQALVHTEYTQNSANDSLMWFRSNGDGTCYIYFDPSNPLHRTSESSANIRIPDNWGQRYVPETVDYDGTALRVTAVGDMAFAGCWKLDTLIIPQSVTKLGEGAFEVCNALHKVGTYKSGNSGDWTPVLPAGITEIPTACFARSGITETCLNDNITKIGRLAYYNCGSLATCYIPDGVETIGDYAFYNCTSGSLTTVTFPASVVTVGDNAFGHNYDATSTSPKFSNIMTFYFEGNTPPTLAGTLFTYGDGSRAETGDPVIIVPTESVDAYKTAWTKYAEFIIPMSDEKYYCTKIIVPAKMTVIPAERYKDFTKVTAITINEGVEEIGEKAFYGCINSSMATTVTLPSTITKIGNMAFGHDATVDANSYMRITSYKLYSVVPPTLEGELASKFRYNTTAHNFTIYVPDESIHDYLNDKAWSIYEDRLATYAKSIEVAEGTTEIAAEQYICYRSAESITLPEGLQKIGEKAFYNCTSGHLVSITIPSTVTSIGRLAFGHTSGAANYSRIATYNILAETPPTLDGDLFQIDSHVKLAGIKIYVPAASVDAYKTAEGWSQYASIIEAAQ